ncbi:DUF4270 family protein [Portibacter lacus]|uniref:DUF4270 domain-containing protein n=1 Tax=Portibacter lacus TaxID=1099794 RepID=A0AA37SMC8_9BACT|nr:DUF4270 family protein [Portibacter lacus]GLR16570.1 hypothetical protein GCM10007940_11850 [Portibacter lacus]
MKVLLYSLAAMLALVFTFSCNKTSLVGSELFVPGSINLLYEDDFEITGKTIMGDSIITYDGTSSISTLTIGELNDPVFGKTIGEGYVSLNRASTAPIFQYDDGQKVTLDSAVLILSYKHDGFYGDTLTRQEISVNVLEEDIFGADTMYSSFRPSAGSLIGSKSIVPNFNDSLFITEPGDTSVSAYAQQLRITLDDSWAQAMIDDTTLVSSFDNFNAYAPGLKISSTPETSATFGLDFSTNQENPYNYITIYYTKDTLQLTYTIIVGNARHSYFEKDYSGSVVAPFFNDEEKGKELLYLQGLTGAEVEIDIPVLASNDFDEYLVNKAELEFYVLEDDISSDYSPAEAIYLERYNDDGETVVISDVIAASETGVVNIFNGLLQNTTVDGMTIKKYSAIMSIHTISMFNDDDPDSKLRIVTRNNSIVPNRSIIYGPGHPTYPMKFKLNYSK